MLSVNVSNDSFNVRYGRTMEIIIVTTCQFKSLALNILSPNSLDWLNSCNRESARVSHGMLYLYAARCQ